MQEIITCAASLSIGLILGLIGAGGSILTLPVFVYILKMDPISSSVYSMFVVGIASVTGSIKSILNRLVDFKVSMAFGVPSLIGVLIARKIIFPRIPLELYTIGDFILTKKILFMLCFSILMFIAAFRMLRTASGKDSGKENTEEIKPLWLLLQGLTVGMITGLLGIGGGFLIVPALFLWGRLPMKKVIGTTLVIIALNSLFGFATSYSTAVIDWNLLIRFTLGSMTGILIGSSLAGKFRDLHLKKIFGWFVLGISVFILCNQFFF
jgi:uncharacterized membrane protein YfcA